MAKENEAALTAADVPEITDAQVLFDIALGEPDEGMRNAAIDRLNGMKDLPDIDVYEWRKWTYDESDEPAMDEYWYGSDRYQNDPGVRWSAARNFTNQRILIQVACKDPVFNVRNAAVGRITDTVFLEGMRRYDRISDNMQYAAGKRLCELYDLPLSALSEEWVSIFDEAYHCTGTAPRSLVHECGLWHETFHCWFMENDGERAYLWFQKRSSKKKDYPDLLDITAAGHLLADESAEDGAREIREELGLSVVFQNLLPLGIRVNTERTPKLYNNEFNRVYLYRSPYALKDVSFADGEVQGIFRIAAEDGIRLFQGKAGQIDAEGYVLQEGALCAVRQPVSLYSFVPRTVDQYYLKMCIIADLQAKGYPHAAI